MTLTQTANITKQVITLSTIALILAVGSFIGYKIWYSYYLSTLPPVEEKPDTKFGVLPAPLLPSASVSSSNFSYSIDTTTGSLPKLGEAGFEKIIKVYFLIKPLASFLSSDRSQALAAKFGITNPPQIISETKYLFEQDQKKLTVDLDNDNFKFSKIASPSGSEKLDDDSKLSSDFESVLNNLGILKPQIMDGRFKIIPNSAVRSEANSASIYLWSKSINNKSIFTADFNKALINATVLGSAQNLDNYTVLNFTFWQVDENIYATYPTKLPQNALLDLQSGKGVIVVEPTKPQVSITSIYLGYYLSENYSQFLQPIYIFEGPSFVAYVSAIDSPFIEGAR